MSATVIDLQAERKRRAEAATEACEALRLAHRPWSSMDDLPDVTPEGQREIESYLAQWYWSEEHTCT